MCLINSEKLYAFIILLIGFVPMLLVVFGYRELNTAMPDSGTTFTYLPPSAYAKAKERWRSPPGGCPWGECSKRAAKGEYPDDYCYTMTEEEMAKFA